MPNKKGLPKIALGHHRDDLVESLLMSILYSGEIRSQPPKLITNDRKHIVIRPLAYCQEKDIARYAAEQNFPIIPCGECGNQVKLNACSCQKVIKAISPWKIPRFQVMLCMHYKLFELAN